MTKETPGGVSFVIGPSDRVRTCGLMVPNHARYQLRHTRMPCLCSSVIIYQVARMRK